LDDYVSDIDNNDSEITWTATGQNELTITINNRVAIITLPNINWNGSETVLFTAADTGGLTAADSVSFTVNAVNDAPVVSDISDQSITEGSTFTAIQLDDYVSDIDNNDSEITWTATGQNELTITINNRVATITIPNENWNGSETVLFTAADTGGLTAADFVSFTVNAVNDAPVVSDISDQSITEGATFTAIQLDDYVSDIDNNDSEITWTATGQNELTITINNRVAIITLPNINWNGSETVLFTAADTGGLTAADSVSFTV
ncbi:hypothetical protein MHK_010364, partial [Candidatus Magnetomorum sp. HK-1]